eukprot:XP_014774353.1 PREDICTED: uncharacterized protein K02A2.6-like [Octopus bimaculoides]
MCPSSKITVDKSEPWPKVNVLWLKLHISFTGPLNGSYYLMLVDSLSKWPEICKGKKPTLSTVTNFLPELFARFGVPDVIMSDNGTQFVLFEFKKFHKRFAVEHVTTVPYHPRSNGQAEHFVVTFKRALRKLNKEVMDKVALQQFLRVYRVTPNPNTPAGMSPAKLMFVRKI